MTENLNPRGGAPAWPTADREKVRAMVASGMSSPEVAAATGRSRGAIMAGVNRYGLGPWLTKPGVKSTCPPDFAQRWATTTPVKQLAAEIGCGVNTMYCWAGQMGLPPRPKRVQLATTVRMPHRPRPKAPIKPRRYATGSAARMFNKPDLTIRDTSLIGRAVDHLRRFGAVYRCGPNGGADTKGKFWRRGSAVLTDDEVLERAVRNGFVADEWSRVG